MSEDKQTNNVEKSTAVAGQNERLVMRRPSLTGEYHTDCNLLLERIEELGWALKDAQLFSEWVECLGRTDCEIYKHELKASADLSISRIEKAIDA